MDSGFMDALGRVSYQLSLGVGAQGSLSLLPYLLQTLLVPFSADYQLHSSTRLAPCQFQHGPKPSPAPISAAKRLAADGDSDLTGFGSIDAFGRPGDEFVLCLNYCIFAVSGGATSAALALGASHWDADTVFGTRTRRHTPRLPSTLWIHDRG
ncbi:hypothetical protein BDZ89DRAFT_1045250 [Hymenopellis radicata]|nr:hypothetical protein BDZ89DRAFT_1045250 [Hymenopellis radicata]